MSSPFALLSLFLKLAITVWLVIVALWDRRTGRIPNKLTFPVMLVAGGYRLAQTLYLLLSREITFLGSRKWEWLSPGEALLPPMASPLFVWIAWFIIFLLWSVNIVGGGDAKMLMGLFAIFPTLEFTFAFACLILLIGVPWLVLARWGTRAGTLVQSLYVRLLTLGLLPSAKELAERKGSYAWLFCLAAVIYAWLFW